MRRIDNVVTRAHVRGKGTGGRREPHNIRIYCTCIPRCRKTSCTRKGKPLKIDYHDRGGGGGGVLTSSSGTEYKWWRGTAGVSCPW